MTALRRFILLAGCVLSAACVTSGAKSATPRENATVTVDNQALLDMTIYVLRGSQRVRIGTANSLSKTRLSIPAGILFGATSLRFIADPIGGNRSPVSEEVIVTEGEEIGLRIPPG